MVTHAQVLFSEWSILVKDPTLNIDEVNCWDPRLLNGENFPKQASDDVDVYDQDEYHVKYFEKSFRLLSLVRVTDNFGDTADTQDFNHSNNFEEIN